MTTILATKADIHRAATKYSYRGECGKILVRKDSTKAHDCLTNYLIMGYYIIKNQRVAIDDSLFLKGEKALIAQENIAKHTIIFLYEDNATDQRTRTSIQVAANKHIEPGDFGAFANHSCEPNTQIIVNYDEERNVAQVLMLSIKPIQKGEEITFDYATTETTVTSDLMNKTCLCGSKKCRGKITGFNELSEHQQMELLANELTANYLQLIE